VGKVLGKFSLWPHPAGPMRPFALECTVSRAGASWRFAFVLTGKIGLISLPAPVQARRADGLWRQTCFEGFLGGEDAAYHELNFSPSGQWASYVFSHYREGMRVAEHLSLSALACHHDSARLELSATIVRADGADPRWTRLALGAVIVEQEGTSSYWALAHPPGLPDFHHPTCFAARLGAADRP